MSIKNVYMKKRKRRNGFEIWKLIWINIRVLPTGTRCIVDKASARQAKDQCSSPKRVSDYSFIPLRSFFSAIIAKRGKVQLRQVFAQFNNDD